MSVLEKVEATIEIDDVFAAAAALAELKKCDPEAKILALARWMAGSRVYYTQVGRSLSKDS